MPRASSPCARLAQVPRRARHHRAPPRRAAQTREATTGITAGYCGPRRAIAPPRVATASIISHTVTPFFSSPPDSPLS